jgi:branched-chain amino acid transport system substrate-binding protein
MNIGARKRMGLATMICASLLAACGSDAEDEPGSAKPTGPEPTGEPVKLMIIGAKNHPVISQANMFAAAQAKVDYVNDSGGVGGHPLELVVCDTNLDPNLEADCLEEAVSENVSAIVGAMLVFTTDYSKLEAAQIPLIATQTLSPGEINYPHAFLFGNGVVFFKAMATLAADDGMKKVAVSWPDTATGVFGGELVSGVLESRDVEIVTGLAHAATGADRSAEAATLVAEDPEAVVLAGSTETVIPLIQAIRQAGYGGEIYAYSSALPPKAVEELGDFGEGVRLIGRGRFISDDHEKVQQYKDDILNYAPENTAMDERGTVGWSSVDLFATVMADATAFTGADVIAAFNQLTEPVDAGTFGPFVGAPAPGCDPEFPTILNTNYIVGTIEDGEVVADTGEFQSYC